MKTRGDRTSEGSGKEQESRCDSKTKQRMGVERGDKNEAENKGMRGKKSRDETKAERCDGDSIFLRLELDLQNG